VQVIGRGAFGEVTLSRSRDTGTLVAIKRLSKATMVAKSQAKHVLAEREALSELSAGGWVARLRQSFQDSTSLYLVMDPYLGGDLMQLLIKRDVLDEATTRFITAELVAAIGAVHAAGYVHRDIKPDNVLFAADGHLSLSDLGLCRSLYEPGSGGGGDGGGGGGGGGAAPAAAPAADGGASTHARPFSVVGTPDYIAPEILLKTGHYGAEVDWWSLGACVYECVVGRPPFASGDAAATCKKIARFTETLSWPADRLGVLSPACIDFMRRLLTAAPARLGTRGGAAEVAAHPWLAGLDLATLRAQRAPYQPPIGDVAAATVRLASLPRTHADFEGTVRRLLCCFDNFDHLPAGDPRIAFHAGDAAAPSSSTSAARPHQRIIGYTYVAAPHVGGAPPPPPPPPPAEPHAAAEPAPAAAGKPAE